MRPLLDGRVEPAAAAGVASTGGGCCALVGDGSGGAFMCKILLPGDSDGSGGALAGDGVGGTAMCKILLPGVSRMCKILLPGVSLTSTGAAEAGVEGTCCLSLRGDWPTMNADESCADVNCA